MTAAWQRDNRKRLLAALRAIPADGRPLQVPGDGAFLWDYGQYLDEYPRDRALPAHRARSLRGRGARVRAGWCGSVGCAMGLATLMGIVREPHVEDMARALGMDEHDAHDVFHDDDTYGAEDYRDVTPHQVADELERRLSA